MRRGKLAKARPWLDELRREGIDYEPLGVSCFGRWDSHAAAIIERLVRRAARRCGLASPAGMRRRTRARLAVEVWRRTVACVRTCLPRDEGDGGHEAAALPASSLD